MSEISISDAIPSIGSPPIRRLPENISISWADMSEELDNYRNSSSRSGPDISDFVIDQKFEDIKLSIDSAERPAEVKDFRRTFYDVFELNSGFSQSFPAIAKRIADVATSKLQLNIKLNNSNSNDGLSYNSRDVIQGEHLNNGSAEFLGDMIAEGMSGKLRGRKFGAFLSCISNFFVAKKFDKTLRSGEKLFGHYLYITYQKMLVFDKNETVPSNEKLARTSAILQKSIDDTLDEIGRIVPSNEEIFKKSLLQTIDLVCRLMLKIVASNNDGSMSRLASVINTWRASGSTLIRQQAGYKKIWKLNDSGRERAKRSGKAIKKSQETSRYFNEVSVPNFPIVQAGKLRTNEIERRFIGELNTRLARLPTTAGSYIDNFVDDDKKVAAATKILNAARAAAHRVHNFIENRKGSAHKILVTNQNKLLDLNRADERERRAARETKFSGSEWFDAMTTVISQRSAIDVIDLNFSTIREGRNQGEYVRDFANFYNAEIGGDTFCSRYNSQMQRRMLIPSRKNVPAVPSFVGSKRSQSNLSSGDVKFDATKKHRVEPSRDNEDRELEAGVQASLASMNVTDVRNSSNTSNLNRVLD